MAKDSGIRFTRQSQKLLERLEKVLSVRELFEALFRRMDMIATKASGFVIQESLSGKLLKRRTGTLARSVIGRAVKVHGLPAIRVGVFRGPATRYAGALEYGATIVPVKAKALAIPQEPVLTSAGVERYGGPRQYPGTLRFLPFRRGIAVGKLVDEAEAEKLEDHDRSPYEARAYYLLLTKVEIPAFHWLSGAMKIYLPQIAEELAAYIGDLFHGRATI